MRPLFLVLFFSFFFIKNNIAQETKKLRLLSFETADSLDKKRVWAITGFGTSCYVGVFTLLNQAWYSNYSKVPFHYFNDNDEWLQMDKVGHVFSSYFESRWFSQGYKWAGVRQKNAAWIGFGAGMLIQGTLEFSDSRSEKWGFSKGDIWGNTIGASLFLSQELLWKEQRLMMKVSNTPVKYPSDLAFSDDKKYSIPLSNKAADLYGNNYIVSFLKDYNAQTLWLSANIHSFLPNSRVPKWLNLAVGYGAQNMYVGDNQYFWKQESAKNGIPAGTVFNIDKNSFPRYRQYYLSLDVDLTKIKTKSHFLRTIFHAVNVLKIPAPTLEFNSLGKMRFHPIYF